MTARLRPLAPEELHEEKLRRVVRDIQRLLFLEEVVESDLTVEVWDPCKEHGSETLDAIIAIYRDAGLAPSGVKLGDA